MVQPSGIPWIKLFDKFRRRRDGKKSCWDSLRFPISPSSSCWYILKHSGNDVIWFWPKLTWRRWGRALRAQARDTSLISFAWIDSWTSLGHCPIHSGAVRNLFRFKLSIRITGANAGGWSGKASNLFPSRMTSSSPQAAHTWSGNRVLVKLVIYDQTWNPRNGISILSCSLESEVWPAMVETPVFDQ